MQFNKIFAAPSASNARQPLELMKTSPAYDPSASIPTFYILPKNHMKALERLNQKVPLKAWNKFLDYSKAQGENQDVAPLTLMSQYYDTQEEIYFMLKHIMAAHVTDWKDVVGDNDEQVPFDHNTAVLFMENEPFRDWVNDQAEQLAKAEEESKEATTELKKKSKNGSAGKSSGVSSPEPAPQS